MIYIYGDDKNKTLLSVAISRGRKQKYYKRFFYRKKEENWRFKEKNWEIKKIQPFFHTLAHCLGANSVAEIPSALLESSACVIGLRHPSSSVSSGWKLIFHGEGCVIRICFFLRSSFEARGDASSLSFSLMTCRYLQAFDNRFANSSIPKFATFYRRFFAHFTTTGTAFGEEFSKFLSSSSPS